MAKIKFQEVNLHKKSLWKIQRVNEIVEEYLSKGYDMTLRQLYYQMVARGFIQNNMNEYRSIGEVVKFGRLGGLIDWDAIVDRTREPKDVWVVDGVEDAVAEAIRIFRRDRQEGQQNHIEVWVEKDAISSILWRKTSHYGVTLMVNRGYASITSMFDAAQRFKKAEEQGKQVHILYFGDHDPSGLDMLRDINDRQEIFTQEPILKHIGITREQINRLNPPPFPTKINDPRSSKYIEEHGHTAWELDALPPEILFETMEKEIESLMDMQKFTRMIAIETDEREFLRKMPEKSRDLIHLLKEYDGVEISQENSDPIKVIGEIEGIVRPYIEKHL